jgi:hypothetical protein
MNMNALRGNLSQDSFKKATFSGCSVPAWARSGTSGPILIQNDGKNYIDHQFEPKNIKVCEEFVSKILSFFSDFSFRTRP